MEKVILFSRDKNNKIKEWSIYVEDYGNYSVVCCAYGYIDGKKTSSKSKVDSGKNIGKKNETTHLQQAVLEAKSKIEKKIKEGYAEHINNKQEEIQVSNNNKTFLPMLAQEYNKHKSKVKYPCYIQPKLDGYRMIYNPVDDTMRSRTGAEFEVLRDSNIHRELKALNLKCAVDGEIYVHKTFAFEDYGILRKKKISELDVAKLGMLEYHIYDIVLEEETFSNRLELMEHIKDRVKRNDYKYIKVVSTFKCGNEKDVKSYHEQYLQDSYEGTIVRNSEGKYKCKFRSYDLLKLKDFDDGEFRIVNFSFEKDTKAKDNNLVVWICETSDKKKFNVQSKGTREERQELYKNAEKYVGKMLWVQYFGLTSEGIPRFPKTMRSGEEAIREVKN
jgi:ATP-dependent DNA ligase